MRIFTFFVAVFLTFFAAGAQLLWTVSGNGLEKPSYLLATHHIAPADMLDSIAGFDEALAEVYAVYGEMDMQKALSPEMQMQLSAYMTAPADSTLDKVLTPAQLDTLATAMYEATKIPADFSRMPPVKPAVFSNLISMALSTELFPGFSPESRIDAGVQKRALAMGKQVEGFETMAEQASLLFGVPVRIQADELMELVRDLDHTRSMTVRIALAYTSQNLDSINAVLADSDLSPEKTEQLLDGRNRRWAETLAETMPLRPVICAVGAAHLPGPHGLIALLREMGYKVEPYVFAVDKDIH